jgi:hypothetical protein
MNSIKSYNDFKKFCLETPIELNKQPEQGKRYESVFIDFRIIPHAKYVITNLINKLSNDWSHTVVCGPSNYEYMKKIAPFTQIIKLNLDIKNINDYNNLLLTTDFWNLFDGEKLLIYQEDSILFHGEIEPFMEYDYIGAPWIQDHVPDGYGGNGGLSLRTKSVMIECLNKHIPPPYTYFDRQPEDFYFSNTLYHNGIGKLAPRKVAMNFSQEQIISKTAMGGHQFWMAR